MRGSFERERERESRFFERKRDMQRERDARLLRERERC